MLSLFLSLHSSSQERSKMISSLSEPAKTMLSEVDKSLSGKVRMFANVYSKSKVHFLCVLLTGNGNIF